MVSRHERHDAGVFTDNELLAQEEEGLASCDICGKSDDHTHTQQEIYGTCEMDGYDEDSYGREHYWHCENIAVGEITAPAGFRILVCVDHMEEE